MRTLRLTLLLSSLLGLLWPLNLPCAEAVQKLVRMGLILPGSAEDAAAMKEALFWERLRALGWEEGRNLHVERRFAQGRKDDFPAFMEEMVRSKVDVIVTTSTPAALSAKRGFCEEPGRATCRSGNLRNFP